MSADDDINTVTKASMYEKTAGVLLLMEGFVLLLPLVILGAAIDWPQSLQNDAEKQMPLIMDNAASVFAGYAIYLFYSVSFLPVAYFTGRVVVGEDDLHNPLFAIANGIAVISTVMRTLGIVRWLFVMPTLARMYNACGASAQVKAIVSVVYEALNDYAGGVGELCGVSLFACIWMVCIGVLIIRSPRWPKWLGTYAFFSAFMLCLPLMEMSILNVDMGPIIALSTAMLQLFFFLTAALFLDCKCVRRCQHPGHSAPELGARELSFR